ncbi:MAG: hypothetical protein FWG98_10090 [Candidatus Cloacimonetes bacterium]|nr:hypothetical protein [Candidatus Cloacimonadota bacterium]
MLNNNVLTPAGSRNYMYLLLYPNHSLIASQLEPAKFAQHYAQGSTGFFGGNFLFVEVDSDYRNDYFKIDEAFEQLKPHEDGRPKATKFICNYRTLEHIDFESMRNLYYCNALGNFIELVPDEFNPAASDVNRKGAVLNDSSKEELSIFLGINPAKLVVLSRQSFKDYGIFITDPETIVSTPTILYTKVNLDIDDFLSQFEVNPFMPLKIPGIHPSRMRDAIIEVRTSPSKINKGISMDCPFDKISYRSLRYGFMFATREKTKFYPLIPMDEVEKDFYTFWKSM